MLELHLTQLAGALRSEERRCSYLSEEVKLIHSMKDDFGLVLENSDLAWNLHNFYKALGKGTAHPSTLTINNSAKFSCSLRNPENHPTTCLKPFMTLLMLPPSCEKLRNIFSFKQLQQVIRSDLLKVLPDDASRKLVTAINKVRPYRDFRDLSSETGLTLPFTYRCAGHLMYWGKAKLIDPITKDAIYCLNPKMEMDPFLFDTLFNNVFPKRDRLELELAKFNFPTRVGDMDEYRSEPGALLSIITFMLQFGLIERVYDFVDMAEPQRLRGSRTRNSATSLASRPNPTLLDMLNEGNALGSTSPRGSTGALILPKPKILRSRRSEPNLKKLLQQDSPDLLERLADPSKPQRIESLFSLRLLDHKSPTDQSSKSSNHRSPMFQSPGLPPKAAPRVLGKFMLPKSTASMSRGNNLTLQGIANADKTFDLCRVYFDGRHTVEEILYLCPEVSREDWKQMTMMYSNSIRIYQHMLPENHYSYI